MLLFYEVLTRPTRRLILSYPAMDSAAQPLTPSPYLFELQQLCGTAWPAGQTSPLHLSPLPAWPEPHSPRDLRLLAVHHAQQENVTPLATLIGRDTGSLASSLTAGLLVAEHRQAREFGPFEGLLPGSAARQLLLDRYGPQRNWSASQLEQYIFCPYQFFLQSVLKLEPLKDLELSFDFMARGQLLHSTLAALHRRLNERAGGPTPLSQLDPGELLAEAVAVLNELATPLAGTSPLRQALGEIDRRLLLVSLTSYLKQHRQYEAKHAESIQRLRPAYFEVGFGQTGGRGGDSSRDPAEDLLGDPLSTADPYPFVCGDETILLSGRIDRIDLGYAEGGLVFNVVDYKSGSSRRYSVNAVRSGEVLQLPLYTLAAAELLLAAQEAAPWQAGYWFLKDAGYKNAIVCHELSGGKLRPTSEWRALCEQLAAWVLSAIRGIRQGDFPVVCADEKCTSNCDYSTVCRVNQIRSLEKVWPAAEAPAQPSPAIPAGAS
jgi:ATP-dependent helicase/nuclease subunit B